MKLDQLIQSSTSKYSELEAMNLSQTQSQERKSRKLIFEYTVTQESTAATCGMRSLSSTKSITTLTRPPQKTYNFRRPYREQLWSSSNLPEVT
ncbi:hypothetical protein TNCV_2180821 [Trichonephila clavipes]|uniref:Uncharacterized protein n=1 Tax=Trichonephila clavipes TaxID=2585209 RepID=A0A8X6VUV0_TRICX|nr:hypothetical protein TNCV_2180821 [Trichonephila clavipes]